MLSWDFPPRATGGIAAQVSGLSAALAAAGHDVVVLTVADRPAELDAVARPTSGSFAPRSTSRGSHRWRS
jgi:glycogen synthase